MTSVHVCASELPAAQKQRTLVGNWSRKVSAVDIPAKWLPREFDQGLWLVWADVDVFSDMWLCL